MKVAADPAGGIDLVREGGVPGDFEIGFEPNAGGVDGVLQPARGLDAVLTGRHRYRACAGEGVDEVATNGEILRPGLHVREQVRPRLA